MAYSTPFTQSFGSHSNMYSSLKTGGMPSMPYHMSSLGLGSLGMSSLDPMHPATMNYGAPCKNLSRLYFSMLTIPVQLVGRNRGERGPPSPGSSWMCWSRSSRRRDTPISS